MMELTAKIYVAGHTGLVGSSLMRRLTSAGYTHLITRTVQELDLRNQQAVTAFFAQEQPEYIFLAAAKVGGIKANMDAPASFIYDNLMINTNVIHAAYTYQAKKLLFLGSSCIYPRNCPQPIKEEYLLSGALETTNDAYAIAKIAGIKLCQAYNQQYKTRFIIGMPTNLYGPHDNFDAQTSHVVPALLAKMMQAKKSGQNSVTVWGTGTACREFLYVDDLADAALFLMHHYEGTDPINIGTGNDMSIAQLANRIKEVVGFKGALLFDTTQPDGTPKKVLNVDALHALGWKAKTEFAEGIEKTKVWYEQRYMI